MKYIIIIILAIFLVGCTQPIIADTVPITPETITVTKTVTETIIDNTKVIELQKQLQSKDIELDKYKSLINNLNDLLSNVYYVETSNSKWIVNGTGFSIIYKDKYYLITAGHAVEQEGYGKFYNHKFKANFTNNWVYPKLLKYEDNGVEIDYAVFYSDKIKSGLQTSNQFESEYILGNTIESLNIVREDIGFSENGESGSPIINENGDVIGIKTSNDIYTKINIVTKAIDTLQ
jgi:hypothetical protein